MADVTTRDEALETCGRGEVRVVEEQCRAGGQAVRRCRLNRR